MDAIKHLSVELRRRGFVTRADAVAAGVPRLGFTHAAKRLGLTAQYRGLWTADEADLSFEQAAEAALTTIPEPALLTGATALRLLGVTTAHSDDAEVLVPLRRSPARREGICVHHTSTYDDVRYQHVGGLRVAAAARAVADYAAHATLKQIAMVLAEADRLRLVRLAQIAAEILARKRFPGRRRLRTVHDDMAGEVTHSRDEGRARRLLAGEGIVPHRRPLTVERNSRLVGEIDLPFIAELYGVEVDGPRHLLADVAAADRIRDRELGRLGWQIDRFFWFELDERPTWFVGEVARRLAERAGTTPAAGTTG